ncbi:MAG: MaoC family dehydratase [Chloroflexi bacterium]|nr:MaoC family dehydratase [Chloroflexota bacterium]
MADEITFPIEAGHIMRFAAAIGDENPIYRDATHARATEPGGVIAPPTYAIASAHFDPDVVRPLPGRPWRGSGAEPTGTPAGPGTDESSRGLHAEQRFVYHRPVRAGETLTVRRRPGETWTKEGRRGGALSFREQISEFVDADGNVVITATMVSVTTSRAVDQ